MYKNIIFTVLLTLLSSMVCSLNPFEIKCITYNRLVADSGSYFGPIIRHNNRLFVSASSKIEEFIIEDNGQLDRISRFETVWLHHLLLSPKNDKLFLFYTMNGGLHLKVFDVSTVPMRYKTTVELPLTSFISAGIIGDKLLIGSLSPEILVINIHSLAIEERVCASDIPWNFTVKDTLIIVPSVLSDVNGIPAGWVYKFHDFTTASVDNPIGVVVHEHPLNMPFIPLTDSKVLESMLYSIHQDHVVIFDISDINDIKLVVSLNDGVFFGDAVLYNNFLVTRYDGGLRVYDISDVNHIQAVYDEVLAGTGIRSLYVFDDVLYSNNTFELVAYSITDNFNKIYNFGNRMVFFARTNEFVIDNSNHQHEIRVFSFIDEKLDDIVINTEDEQEVYFFRYVKLVDEQLYVLSSIGGITHFEAFNLKINERVFRETLNGSLAITFETFGEYIIFKEGPQFARNFVYRFSNNTLDFLSVINGVIGNAYTGYKHDSYFIVLSNMIEFRHNTYPFRIFHTAPRLYNDMVFFEHVADRTISFWNEGFHYIYHYDENFSNFTQTYKRPNVLSTETHFFNQIMSKVGLFHNSLNEFYFIENGIPRKIGELDMHKNVYKTFFYPNDNLLFLISFSGYHIYDLSFKELNLYDEVVKKYLTIDVFPNPVRSSGEVNFKVQVPSINNQVSHFEVSIYNVRGQLVRKVSDFALKDGEGTFVWDRRNDRGIEVSSGVYFYRVSGGEYQKTGRFLVIR